MVMPVQSELPKYTAVESILLAAEDLTKDGHVEFSEFDLTVAAWKRDRNKFGLRGYSDKFPDHKRVMMEIMGQKPNSPVTRKLLEKIRPNTYRLTPAGKDAARRLRTGADNPPKAASAPAPAPTNRISTPTRPAVPSSVELYDRVAHHIGRPEFHRWLANPAEPRDWTAAATFLGLHKGIDDDPIERLDRIRETIRAAMEWCNQSETPNLTRSSGNPGTPIHFNDLAQMLDFLQALEMRFPNHLDKPRRR